MSKTETIFILQNLPLKNPVYLSEWIGKGLQNSVPLISDVPGWGVWGVQTTPPPKFLGPPKSCQSQPDCENC